MNGAGSVGCGALVQSGGGATGAGLHSCGGAVHSVEPPVALDVQSAGGGGGAASSGSGVVGIAPQSVAGGAAGCGVQAGTSLAEELVQSGTGAASVASCALGGGAGIADHASADAGAGSAGVLSAAGGAGAGSGSVSAAAFLTSAAVQSSLGNSCAAGGGGSGSAGAGSGIAGSEGAKVEVADISAAGGGPGAGAGPAAGAGSSVVSMTPSRTRLASVVSASSRSMCRFDASSVTLGRVFTAITTRQRSEVKVTAP